MSKKYRFFLKVYENRDLVRRTLFWAASFEAAKQRVLEMTLSRVREAKDLCPLWTEFPCTREDIDVVDGALEGKAVAVWVDQGWSDFELREELVIKVRAYPESAAWDAYKAREIN